MKIAYLVQRYPDEDEMDEWEFHKYLPRWYDETSSYVKKIVYAEIEE